MRIAVAGSGRLAVCLMEPLFDSSHQVVAVLQNGRKTKGLKRRLLPMQLSVVGGSSSASGLAYRKGVPVVWLDKMAEELEALRRLDVDVLLVGGFDIILKRPLLDLPRIGCVNAHSSLLPKHRGPNPFSWALLANDRESGITFHVMDEGIDTGDILDQTAFDIGPRDTAMTLYGKACEIASERVVEVMDRIEAQGLHGTPQDPGAASYDPKTREEDTYIDWSLPAEDIERRARAFFPLLMSRFRFRGRTVRVVRLEYDPQPVEAAPGTILCGVPPVRIATGRGTITLAGSAWCTKPAPFLWPPFWDRPSPGDKVE